MIKFSSIALILLFIVYFASDVKANEFFLPSDNFLPKVEIPSSSSIAHLKFDDLEIVDRGRVRFLINLDGTAMRAADELLNLRVGFSQHWSPGSIYALFPAGYEHDPDRASVFLSSLKLKFRRTFAVESDEVVRAVNQPIYTMYRQENWIVVSKSDERRWYFESADGGLSWRLGQMEFIKHPGMFTRLQYEGDKVVAIIFPNGQQAAIEYEGDLPRKIQTPFGQTVTIAYGTGGYISQIDVVSLPDEEGPRMPKETKTYKFTCNADGQIREMITPDGEVYTCEYQTSSSVEAGVNKREDQTTMRRKRDGLFITRIDEFRVDREWVVRILRGGSKDDLSTAYPEYWGRLQNVAGKWQMTGYGRDAASVEESFSSDEKGKQIMQTGADGAVTTTHLNEMGKPLMINDSRETQLFEYNQFGQITRVVTPEGNETTWTYDEHARKLHEKTFYDTVFNFEYDERGFPIGCKINTQQYRYEFGDWGRMLWLEKATGENSKWDYDNLGRIIRVTEFSAKKEDVKSIRTYHYSDGRLMVIKHHQGDKIESERFIYNRQGQLTQHRYVNGNMVIYKYDQRRGWLESRVDLASTSEAWTYHDNGQIKTYRSWQGSQTLMTQEFDAMGNKVAEKKFQQ